MKVSKTLVLKIAIGLAIALTIAIILGYLNVLRKDKAEKAPKEAEKAKDKDIAAEVKISAEIQPGEALISSVFIENDLVLEVFPAIAKQAGVSIIPDESVSGLITCTLKDAPIDRALEIVLAGTNYTVKKMPNHYLICPRDIKNRSIFIRIKEFLLSFF